MNPLGESTGSGFRERRVGDAYILTVFGGLKGAGELALRNRLDELARYKDLQVLIDLRELPYMDSTELGRLIRCHISVRQAGGRVRICNISDRVMHLMRLTHMDRVFDLYSTEEEALSTMGTGYSTPH